MTSDTPDLIRRDIAKAMLATAAVAVTDLRLAARGARSTRKRSAQLDRTQSPLFQSPRPEIEFFAAELDPMQIDNLASRPGFQAVIAEYFSMLEKWKVTTHDFPPERRQRAGYVDRITGVLFPPVVPPMFNE